MASRLRARAPSIRILLGATIARTADQFVDFQLPHEDRHRVPLPRHTPANGPLTTPSPLRPGFTLLELLIVLVLLGVASAIVVPTVGRSRASTTSETERLTMHARRLAIQRAERLRLRLAPSGVWTLRSAQTDEPVDSGLVRRSKSSETESLLFDALGDCLPDARIGNAAPFDALACRGAMTPATSEGGAP